MSAARWGPGAFALGTATGLALPADGEAVATAILLFSALVAGASALSRRAGAEASPPRLVAILAFALGCGHGLGPPPLDLPDVEGRVVDVTGTAVRIDRDPPVREGAPELERVRLRRVAVRTPSGAFAAPDAWLRLPPEVAAPPPGTRVRARALLACRDGRVTLAAAPGEPLIIESHPWATALRGLIESLRARIRDRLESARLEHGDLVRALLLGDPLRDEAFLDDVRAAGAAHLFVVSGFHLSLVAFAVRRASRRLVRRPARAALLTACACTLYALLAGANAPVARALGMLALWRLGRWLCRGVEPLVLLALCAAVPLALDRELARDPSFTLSYAALVGLFGFASADASSRDPLDAFLDRKLRSRRIRAALRRRLTASWGALAGVAAPSFAFFGSVAPLSILASIALGPPIALLLLLAMLLPLVPELGPLADALAGPIVLAVEALARPHLVIVAGEASSACAWSAAIAVVVAVFLLRHGWRAGALLPFLPLALGAAAMAAADDETSSLRALRTGDGSVVWSLVSGAGALEVRGAAPTLPSGPAAAEAPRSARVDLAAGGGSARAELPGSAGVEAPFRLDWRGLAVRTIALDAGRCALLVETAEGRTIFADAARADELAALARRYRPQRMTVPAGVSAATLEAVLLAGARSVARPRDGPGGRSPASVRFGAEHDGRSTRATRR